VAGRLGFRAVHAARPPVAVPAARRAIEERGLSLEGVAAPPLPRVPAVADAARRAAEAAAALGTRVLVLDGGDLSVPEGRPAEPEVDALARALFGALAEVSGAAIALRHSGRAGALLGPRECSWLLDALKGKAFGLWFDPARAAASGALPVLDWADRFGARTVGIVLDGDEGTDWGTLRGLVPSRAVRVLHAGPEVSDPEVVDLRRRFEEKLGW
jgi:hypothetical protein